MLRLMKSLLAVWLLLLVIPTGVQETKSVVAYVFLSTECPISQAAVPSINMLAKKYPLVQFRAVFTFWDPVPQVHAFASKYSLGVPAICDEQHKLIQQWEVTTTPEVILLDGQQKLVYRGLLDNGYVALGQKRSTPITNYLDSALFELSSAGRVSLPFTKPVGCKIEPIPR